MKLFKETPSKPYYLLAAKDLDMVIYYHKKYLQQMRENKLKADHEEVVQRGKPVFFTNVDIDTIEEKPENETAELEKQRDAGVRSGVQSMQSIRPHRGFKGDTSSRHLKQGSLNDIRKHRQPHWIKKKKGPKFLLDFRRNKPEKIGFEETKENNLDKMRHMYQNYPQAHRATYFIPKLRGPRNPQLAKIEAYFVVFFDI